MTSMPVTPSIKDVPLQKGHFSWQSPWSSMWTDTSVRHLGTFPCPTNNQKTSTQHRESMYASLDALNNMHASNWRNGH